jgi:hypothetical protein
MSCYSVAEEIMRGRADFLVELRGFEPMAIAGVGIRQSREFRARAASFAPAKSGTEQRRRVFLDHGNQSASSAIRSAPRSSSQ